MSLRPPREDEIPFIRRMWGDFETMAAVGGPADLSDSEAEKWFRRMVDLGSTPDFYCLISREDGSPVGEVSFHRWDPVQGEAELNIKVLAAERGKGYAHDALLTFLRFFFERFGGKVLMDDVGLSNHGGQVLLSKAGFSRDSTVSDVCRMRMTEAQYREKFGGSRSWRK